MIVRSFLKLRWGATALLLSSLVGCGLLSTLPGQAPVAVNAPGAMPDPGASPPVSWQRPKATWTPASWTDLPGWEQDRVQDWWPALWRGCIKPAAPWVPLCAEVRKLGVEWCIEQSRELMKFGVPCLHYYSMGKSEAVRQIASALF